MSIELKASSLDEQSAIPAQPESDPGRASHTQSTALAPAPSEAERRVQLAKERLQNHLAALDHRARTMARQGAWIAGMVLMGIVGVAAATAIFRPKPRRRRYEEPVGRPVGLPLMLTALGLLSRGARALASRRA